MASSAGGRVGARLVLVPSGSSLGRGTVAKRPSWRSTRSTNGAAGVDRGGGEGRARPGRGPVTVRRRVGRGRGTRSTAARRRGRGRPGRGRARRRRQHRQRRGERGRPVRPSGGGRGRSPRHVEGRRDPVDRQVDRPREVTALVGRAAVAVEHGEAALRRACARAGARGHVEVLGLQVRAPPATEQAGGHRVGIGHLDEQHAPRLEHRAGGVELGRRGRGCARGSGACSRRRRSRPAPAARSGNDPAHAPVDPAAALGARSRRAWSMAVERGLGPRRRAMRQKCPWPPPTSSQRSAGSARPPPWSPALVEGRWLVKASSDCSSPSAVVEVAVVDAQPLGLSMGFWNTRPQLRHSTRVKVPGLRWCRSPIRTRRAGRSPCTTGSRREARRRGAPCRPRGPAGTRHGPRPRPLTGRVPSAARAPGRTGPASPARTRRTRSRAAGARGPAVRATRSRRPGAGADDGERHLEGVGDRHGDRGTAPHRGHPSASSSAARPTSAAGVVIEKNASMAPRRQAASSPGVGARRWGARAWPGRRCVPRQDAHRLSRSISSRSAWGSSVARRRTSSWRAGRSRRRCRGEGVVAEGAGVDAAGEVEEAFGGEVGGDEVDDVEVVVAGVEAGGTGGGGVEVDAGGDEDVVGGGDGFVGVVEHRESGDPPPEPQPVAHERSRPRRPRHDPRPGRVVRRVRRPISVPRMRGL